MILTIRTDKPEAEIGLFEEGTELAYETWQAHRQLAETINKKIDALLTAQGGTLGDLTGIVVYNGPGSFTGLRIGVSVANALANGLNIPVFGAGGDNWLRDGVVSLQNGSGGIVVVPEYGSPANITKPKRR